MTDSLMNKTIERYQPIGFLEELSKKYDLIVGLGSVKQWDNKEKTSLMLPVYGIGISNENKTRELLGIYQIKLDDNQNAFSLTYFSSISPNGNEKINKKEDVDALNLDYANVLFYPNGAMYRADNSSLKFPGIPDPKTGNPEFAKLDSYSELFHNILDMDGINPSAITDSDFGDELLIHRIVEDYFMNRTLDDFDPLND